MWYTLLICHVTTLETLIEFFFFGMSVSLVVVCMHISICIYVCWNCRLNYLVTCSLCLTRHEYYQKPEEVVVTIFAKGISAKDVVVDFGEQIVGLYNGCFVFSFTYPCLISSCFTYITLQITWSTLTLQLSVTIDVPGQDAYHYQPRLFGKVTNLYCLCLVICYLIEYCIQ